MEELRLLGQTRTTPLDQLEEDSLELLNLLLLDSVDSVNLLNPLSSSSQQREVDCSEEVS